ATLGLGGVTAKEVYATLDWLGAAQEAIERVLARRHLSDGVMLLYDVTSTYLEGRCCPLAKLGYSRDGQRDKLQIVVGLLCTAEGCPVAVEVFEGNTGDPATLAVQIGKIKQRFGLERVVLVGDRGMITSARIAEELKPAALDWLTALRAPAIQTLAAENGPLQLSLFDDRDLAEIAAFHGLRTTVQQDALSAADTVHAYKSLARVERAFRSMKTVDLELRPVFHWAAPRVRAHVLLCMLAYYLEWHMRQSLAPILFEDHDRAAGEALLASPVAKAQPSPAAKRKAKTKRTDDGLPVHSFRSLLDDLATLTRNA